jgi:hypothetical protein
MGREFTKFLIPGKGLIVRDPSSFTPLAETGEEKPWTGKDGRYWKRRVKVGDAIIMSPEVNITTEIIKKTRSK